MTEAGGTARTALVTGGSRGLGRACADTLAASGAHVVVAARDKSAIDLAVADIKAAGGSAEGLVLDVSQPAAIRAAYASLDEAGHTPNIVVNAAGVFRLGGIRRVSEQDWAEVSAVNATSTLVSCQEAVARMRVAGGGRIINICSVAGALRGVPSAIAYGMSKGAVAALTRCLAVEVAADGITVNAIAPGMFYTEMTDGFRSADGGEWALSRFPMQRWGRPEELGGLVGHLASAEGGFITGQVLAVDGGWTG